MGQQIIIAVLFLAALGYLVYQVYKAFVSRKDCSSGCGTCGVDFNQIREELRKKGV